MDHDFPDGLMKEAASLISSVAKTESYRFLSEVLPTLRGEWWPLVLSNLSKNQSLDVQRRKVTTLAGLDLAALLCVMDRVWFEISDKLQIARDAHVYIKEMRNIRNRWMHAPVVNPMRDDVYRDLDTLQRFLAAINTNNTTLDQVKKLKLSVRDPTVSDSKIPTMGPTNSSLNPTHYRSASNTPVPNLSSPGINRDSGCSKLSSDLEATAERGKNAVRQTITRRAKAGDHTGLIQKALAVMVDSGVQWMTMKQITSDMRFRGAGGRTYFDLFNGLIDAGLIERRSQRPNAYRLKRPDRPA
jgi:hypothetical protein